MRGWRLPVLVTTQVVDARTPLTVELNDVWYGALQEAWKLAGVFGLRTQEAVMTVLRGVQQGPGQGEG